MPAEISGSTLNNKATVIGGMDQVSEAITSYSNTEFARNLLRSLFNLAILEAQPASFMRHYLPKRPSGKLIVVGAGKAAASMAAAFEREWMDAHPQVPFTGVVVTRYGYSVPTSVIRVIEAAHPVPDAASLMGGQAILEAVSDAGPEDTIVALVSGGGSALVCAPVEGVTLADKQALNKALLRSGASIQVMNCIRKHVSRIKGGRLARAAMPAKLVTLMMSDIPGDDVSSIASGPTVSDETTLAMAREFITKYHMELPAPIVAALHDPANETPKDTDLCFRRTENHLVMTPGLVLEKVAMEARAAGFEVLYLGDAIEGEASEVGREHADIAIRARREGRKLCILSGGETTVTLKGNERGGWGKGGRNTEYLLALALHLRGEPDIFALAGDTDGVDGSEDNAGAIITPDTIARAAEIGVDLDRHLAHHDSWSAFHALGDLVITGPTMTNVNDFRAILVLPAKYTGQI